MSHEEALSLYVRAKGSRQNRWQAVQLLVHAGCIGAFVFVLLKML